MEYRLTLSEMFRKKPSYRNKNHGAQLGATANSHACHGLCSEQHTPRQARLSLSLNVSQKNENTSLLDTDIRMRLFIPSKR